MYLASYASELREVVTLPEILCGSETCFRTPTVKQKVVWEIVWTCEIRNNWII